MSKDFEAVAEQFLNGKYQERKAVITVCDVTVKLFAEFAQLAVEATLAEVFKTKGYLSATNSEIAKGMAARIRETHATER